LLYSIVMGGDLTDTVSAIAVSADGNAHVVGTTMSRSFPTTPGAFQTQRGGVITNGFVMKLAPDGQVVYTSYLPYVVVNNAALLNVPAAGIAVTVETSGSALIG